MVKSRLTRQKDIIQNELTNINSFFTSDELHALVCKIDKKIGLATVYRYLKELRKNGKIHFFICNGALIYSLRNKNHCHFICEKCKAVEHFNMKEVDFIKKYVDRKICHFQLDVYGICEKCNQNK